MPYYPLVSVIVPNYNHAQYLSQRIESVLNQTYSNFEVIIFDDNSTDNSKEVIEKYRNHTHIKHIVYNAINSGSTFQQWHKGFNLAKGELIWIAESDDFCDNNMLEILVNQFIIHKTLSIAYCSSQFVNEKGEKIPPICKTTGTLLFYKGLDFIKHKMLYDNAIWNASSAIFKKNNAIQVERSYINYKAAGDRLFWIKLAELGDVVHIKSPKNYFRQHHNKVSPKCLLDGTTSTENYKIFKYILKKGYANTIESLHIRRYNLNKLNERGNIHNDIYNKQYLLWTENGLLSPKILSLLIAINEKVHKLINTQRNGCLNYNSHI